MSIEVTPMEILDELAQTAPIELERAALRVTNRKLSARVAELEQRESPNAETPQQIGEHAETVNRERVGAGASERARIPGD